MTKTITSRIEAALSDDQSRADAQEYLKSIRDNMRTADNDAARIVRQILFAVVAFEFLTRAAIGEASIGGLKFTDLTLIQRLLPVVVAYLYSEQSAVFAARRFLIEVHDVLSAKLNPRFAGEELFRFTYPVTQMTVDDIYEFCTEGRFSTFWLAIRIPQFLGIVFGPVVFLAYAFYRCFTQFGPRDVVVWVALVLSVFLTIRGGLYFLNIEKLAPNTR